MAVKPDLRVPPPKPSAERRRQLAELADWHREWVTGKLRATVPFQPRDASSDYNLHHVDVDADDDAFHQRARLIMGIDDTSSRSDDLDDSEGATRAADPEALHHYWTRGKGLAKWVSSPHPWTALYRHLRKYVGSARAKRMAAQWHHEVFGIWPGEKKGQNPVGPG